MRFRGRGRRSFGRRRGTYRVRRRRATVGRLRIGYRW